MTKKSPPPEPVNPYSKTLTLSLNGEETTLKMTFGLLNQIASTMTGLEDAQMLILDNERLTDMLNLVIAKRDEEGRITKDSPDLRFGDPIELDDYEKLTEWSMGHVMHFFVRRARSLSKAGVALRPELEALNRLTTG